MNILMIGIDRSTQGNRKKLEEKMIAYAKRGVSIRYLLLCPKERWSVRLPAVEIDSFGGANKPLAFANARRALLRMKRRGETFDVVTTQDTIYTGLLGLLAKRLWKIPFVPQIHGDYIDNPLWLRQSKLRPFENFISKRALKKADAVRVVSKRIINDIKKYVRDGAPIRSIPIGTDFAKFFPPSPLPSSRAPALLFVGRLIEEKNPMLFCEIACLMLQKYPDMRVHVAGDGVMKGEMIDIFGRHGFKDRAVFHGNRAPDELRQLYWQSLCYVHTALWEGWGMPMIEAIASGCPVVTTDTGCANEAVRDGVHGFVVAPDAASFSNAIEKLLADPLMQTRFAEAGAKDAAEWSADRQIDNFMALLKDVGSKKDL